MAALVDLVEQSRQHTSCLALGLSPVLPSRDGLAQHIFLPVSWSTPADTFTRADPLGSQPMLPRWRGLEEFDEAMPSTVRAVETTWEATRSLEGLLQSQQTGSDLRSRLGESNPRPTHYECVALTD
jgi:hypothetical protein